jgi:transketolase
VTASTQIAKKFSMKEMYSEGIARIGGISNRVVVLTADVMRSSGAIGFYNKYPDRFYNIGIAEQNMMSIAAGMALEGKLPYPTTFAAFASMRACEQIRTDICYPNLPVRIVATHSGLSSKCGPTHCSQEDIAILRSFVGMTVICPSDPNQIGKVLDASLDYPGPIYIRIGRDAEENIYELDYEYKIGKAIIANPGNDAAIISTGTMLGYAYHAAKQLEASNISVRVVDMHTVKPIDRNAVIDAARTGTIVTVEDHNITGGLGSAIADILAEEGICVRFKKLGIQDVWSAIGMPHQLHHKYGYDTDGIIQAIRQLLV